MKGHSSKNGIAHSFREPKDSLHSLLLVPHNAVMFGGIIIPYTTAGKHTVVLNRHLGYSHGVSAVLDMFY